MGDRDRQQPRVGWLLRFVDDPPRWWLSAWIWAVATPLLWAASILYPLNGGSYQWGSHNFTIPVYENEDGSLSARPSIGSSAVCQVEVTVDYELGRTRWSSYCSATVTDPASPALRVVEARLAAAEATATLREYAPDQDLVARDWLVQSWQEMLRTGACSAWATRPRIG